MVAQPCGATMENSQEVAGIQVQRKFSPLAGTSADGNCLKDAPKARQDPPAQGVHEVEVSEVRSSVRFGVRSFGDRMWRRQGGAQGLPGRSRVRAGASQGAETGRPRCLDDARQRD